LLSLVRAASELGDLRGEAALATELVDLASKRFSIVLVPRPASCGNLRGVRAEGTIAVDVDLVRESVALNAVGELLPLLGEPHAGHGALADQVAYVIGWMSDGELGLAGGVTLVALREFRARGDGVNERVGVLL
jgi:hypothetical protein